MINLILHGFHDGVCLVESTGYSAQLVLSNHMESVLFTLATKVLRHVGIPILPLIAYYADFFQLWINGWLYLGQGIHNIDTSLTQEGGRGENHNSQLGNSPYDAREDPDGTKRKKKNPT